MDTRTLNVVVYLAMAGSAGIVLWQVSGREPVIPGDTGSGFFPAAIAWIIIGLSIIGILRTVAAGSGKRFEITHPARIVTTLVILAIWTLAWQYLGYFYLLEFLLLMGLFTYYRMETGLTARRILENAVIAAGTTLICWIVFNQLIYIDL